MYAIIETRSKQYWVVAGETLKVEKLDGKTGAKLSFNALWVAEEEKDGSGTQKGKVTAEIVRQTKGAKIVVFKKKPKSNYSRQAGHRQQLTEIRISKISLN